MFFEQTGIKIGTLISGENGRNNVIEMFFGFFSSYRNQDGNVPSVYRIKKMKSSISCKLKEEHSLDLFTGEFHQEVSDRWKVVISELDDKFNCIQCGLEFIEYITLHSHLETHNKGYMSNTEELANKEEKNNKELIL